ncbi:hypothetical protein JOQ06_000508, partial [Pogonophryne albipinna]
ALAECDSLCCEVLWRSPRCVGEDGGNEWLTGCQMMEALIQASPKQRLDGGVIHAEARPPRCLGARAPPPAPSVPPPFCPLTHASLGVHNEVSHLHSGRKKSKPGVVTQFEGYFTSGIRPWGVIASSCTAEPKRVLHGFPLLFLASLMPQIPQTTQMYLMPEPLLTSTRATATKQNAFPPLPLWRRQKKSVCDQAFTTACCFIQ